MASNACCTTPPIVSNTDSYTEKGSYTSISSMRTYTSGSSSSKYGVLVIHDIFGLDFKQTLQGADIIASSTNSLVVIPDFFHGNPMDIRNFPPDTPEKKALVGAFFTGPANIQNNISVVKALIPELKSQFPSVEKWAIIGYCWGAKVSIIAASSEERPFAATALLHPALFDPADADKLSVPALCIATKDEDKKAVELFETNLKQSSIAEVRDKSRVFYWDGTFHGFMAARSDLSNKDCLEYYEKG